MTLSDDTRPVDLNEIIRQLSDEIDQGGEHGIWGDYGPPDAPVEYVIGLIRANADAIESRTGMYDEVAQ